MEKNPGKLYTIGNISMLFAISPRQNFLVYYKQKQFHSRNNALKIMAHELSFVGRVLHGAHTARLVYSSKNQIRVNAETCVSHPS